MSVSQYAMSAKRTSFGSLHPNRDRGQVPFRAQQAGEFEFSFDPLEGDVKDLAIRGFQIDRDLHGLEAILVLAVLGPGAGVFVGVRLATLVGLVWRASQRQCDVVWLAHVGLTPRRSPNAALRALSLHPNRDRGQFPFQAQEAGEFEFAFDPLEGHVDDLAVGAFRLATIFMG